MDYIWDEERDDILFFGTEVDLETLNSVIAKCLDIISNSSNPREIVLETWIAVDFALRQFLLSGFELTRFCDKNFDLRYLLLPSSFSELLRIFQETVKYNSKFPLEPEQAPQDKIGGFRSSYEFLKYVEKNHKELFDEIVKVTNEYRRKMNPELHKRLSNGKEIFIVDLKEKIEKMNVEWRKIASKFKESWFKSAKQLNTARNKASHSYDVNEIGLAFGLKGDNLTKKIQTKCRSLLNVLLGVRNNK